MHVKSLPNQVNKYMPIVLTHVICISRTRMWNTMYFLPSIDVLGENMCIQTAHGSKAEVLLWEAWISILFKATWITTTTKLYTGVSVNAMLVIQLCKHETGSYLNKRTKHCVKSVPVLPAEMTETYSSLWHQLYENRRLIPVCRFSLKQIPMFTCLPYCCDREKST